MTHPQERIYVAFDIETTGLSPRDAKVVEIAGVRFTGQGDEIARFSTLANPGHEMSPDVIRIHGIRDDMVRRAPAPEEACRQFASWLHADDVLIAHNAPFDVSFIARALERASFAAPTNEVIDSLKVARALGLDLPNLRLATLISYFDLPEVGYHRALGDSLHVMHLFTVLLRLLSERQDGVSVRDVLRRCRVRGLRDEAQSVGLTSRVSLLPEAIHRGEIVTVQYDGERAEDRVHRVRPIKIVDRDGDSYLTAQCMSDGAVKQFRLDRIIGVQEE